MGKPRNVTSSNTSFFCKKNTRKGLPRKTALISSFYSAVWKSKQSSALYWCKDTHYFRINIISGKIFGNLTEKMYFCTQKKSLPTERLRWSVVFLCRLYGAFLFKSQIGKFSVFCRFVSFIIPLPKRTSGLPQRRFWCPKTETACFRNSAAHLSIFLFFRPLQIPFC